MKRDVSLYVRDILQNMRDVGEFVEGMTYDQFVGDKKTRNAVIRSLEVIGEATKHIPDEMRTAYPAIPWKEMAGMRDKVIHFYFGVDTEVIWFVVKDRIPAIQPIIERILKSL